MVVIDLILCVFRSHIFCVIAVRQTTIKSNPSRSQIFSLGYLRVYALFIVVGCSNDEVAKLDRATLYNL
jgi:hypothetical protein